MSDPLLMWRERTGVLAMLLDAKNRDGEPIAVFLRSNGEIASIYSYQHHVAKQKGHATTRGRIAAEFSNGMRGGEVYARDEEVLNEWMGVGDAPAKRTVVSKDTVPANDGAIVEPNPKVPPKSSRTPELPPAAAKGKIITREKLVKETKLPPEKYYSKISNTQPGNPVITLEMVQELVDKMLGKDYAEVVRNDKLPFAGMFRKATAKQKKAIIELSFSGDILGTTAHEALHALFALLNGSNHPIAQFMMQVASVPAMRKRLERLLENEPKALRQLNDPEEAAAYMFQFWSVGRLEISTRTEGVFGQIKDFLKRILETLHGSIFLLCLCFANLLVYRPLLNRCVK
jgi:hypothetical protein